MRDRLIGIFRNTNYQNRPNGLTANLATQFNEYALREIVDALLASGVIVPPCKVGDDVWFIAKKQDETEFTVIDGNVSCIDIRNGWYHVVIAWTDYQDTYRYVAVFDDFGKTVFLTKEQAEKALAERRTRDE